MVALMLELVDKIDLKSIDFIVVWVRVPLRVQTLI